MTAATNALQDWAADWGAGGLVNALDVIAAQYGRDSVPDTVLDAGAAILEALEYLRLDTGTAPRAGDVYRSEP